MHALILLAHGSREPAATVDLERFAAAVLQHMPQIPTKNRVYPAFLSLGSPNLSEVVERSLQDGAVSIDILPIFLFSGSHVLRDIPDLGREMQMRYPHIPIQILPHIGSAPSLAAFTVEKWREWKTP